MARPNQRWTSVSAARIHWPLKHTHTFPPAPGCKLGGDTATRPPRWVWLDAAECKFERCRLHRCRNVLTI